jgi:hypothetical protein
MYTPARSTLPDAHNTTLSSDTLLLVPTVPVFATLLLNLPFIDLVSLAPSDVSGTTDYIERKAIWSSAEIGRISFLLNNSKHHLFICSFSKLFE